MTARIASHTLYPSQVIHMPAFALAFILAPVLITAATFWLVVPVFALVMGGPVYLILGFPVLLWHLCRHPCSSGRVALVAVLTNLVALTAAAGIGAIQGEDVAGLLLLYGGLGSVFAPLWGFTFAELYIRFTRNA